jgi:hypothetical protein
MAIVPQPYSYNAGGGCGWSGAAITTDVPGTAVISCSDNEGDPLSGRILTEPRHGTAGSPVTVPASYGHSDITIPYVPDPGYEGYDCVVVEVTDGHGTDFQITVDLWVSPEPLLEEEPVDLPPLPLLPLPPVPSGTDGNTKRVARQALGTRAVKRVHAGLGAEVWARKVLSRDDLVRYGRASGMVVVCTSRCQIRSGSALMAGHPRVRANRQNQVGAMPSEHPQVLSLAIRPSQRRALRRAENPRGRFKVTVNAVGDPASSLTQLIPVSR